MNTPALETERLILRKFTEEDLEALFLILKEEANKFLPWYPIKNLEETRKFYGERYEAKYQLPQAYAYAICLKSDNIPIGYINIDMEERFMNDKNKLTMAERRAAGLLWVDTGENINQQIYARGLCQDFNQTRANDTKTRRDILKKLLVFCGEHVWI